LSMEMQVVWPLPHKMCVTSKTEIGWLKQHEKRREKKERAPWLELWGSVHNFPKYDCNCPLSWSLKIEISTRKVSPARPLLCFGWFTKHSSSNSAIQEFRISGSLYHWQKIQFNFIHINEKRFSMLLSVSLDFCQYFLINISSGRSLNVWDVPAVRSMPPPRPWTWSQEGQQETAQLRCRSYVIPRVPLRYAS